MKNNLYTNQKRWKLALAVLAMIIIGITLYYTNHLVRRFAEQESKQIEMWAERDRDLIRQLHLETPQHIGDADPQCRG